MKKLIVGVFAGAALMVAGCRNGGTDQPMGSDQGTGGSGYPQNDDSTQFGAESQPYQSVPQPSKDPSAGTGGGGPDEYEGIDWDVQSDQQPNQAQPAPNAPPGFDPGE